MYLNENDFQIAKEKFNDCGYIIFKEILSNEDVSKYVSALQPYLIKNLQGRNNFEGHKTNRVYGLLDKSPIFGDMVEHPLVMQFVRDELGESALLSALLAINLMPG